MGDAIKESTCKHIASTGKILWLGWKGGHVSLNARVPNVSTVRTIGDNQRLKISSELRKRFLGRSGVRDGTRFRFIAEKQVGVLQRFAERITENVNNECIRTGDGDPGAGLFC